VSALDDTRQFWIFTCTQGHAIGVLTDEGYDRQAALHEMYGGKREVKEALYRGVELRLVDAPQYHERYFEEIRRGCTCPS
jgi:hypothetical protein